MVACAWQTMCILQWTRVRCVDCLYSWFHDKISRKDAEKLLVELNNEPGAFIVRESETVAGLI